MSLKTKQNSFLQSFAFRLTFRYSVLFFLLSVVIFAVTYNSLVSGLRESVDNGLLTEIREFEADLEKEGFEQVRQEIREEIDIVGNKTMFCRLFTQDLSVATASDMSGWGSIDIPVLNAWARLSLDGQLIARTLKLPDSNAEVRIITQKIAGGKYVIQIGQMMRDVHKIAQHYRRVFGTAILLLFVCGNVLAWMLARRAMQGVQRVTQTAKNIGHDGFHHRVQEGREGSEIQDLAVTFNGMLNRIESLITELQDVTNNLAHDLRTPLTRIRGMAETALREQRPGDRNDAELIGIVVEECDRLVQMINTTLEIAHMEAGLNEADRDPVDLADIVRKGGETFLPLAEDKGIRLNVACPPGPVWVPGRVPRLQRVVSNLLDNAIKFTAWGGQVDVRLETGGTGARLSVTDSGIGISPQQQAQIFDKFYRGEGSRSTPGHGLGLSYVKSMITSINGTVAVSSTVGQGAAFVIEIPLQDPPALS